MEPTVHQLLAQHLQNHTSERKGVLAKLAPPIDEVRLQFVNDLIRVTPHDAVVPEPVWSVVEENINTTVAGQGEYATYLHYAAIMTATAALILATQ